MSLIPPLGCRGRGFGEAGGGRGTFGTAEATWGAGFSNTLFVPEARPALAPSEVHCPGLILPSLAATDAPSIRGVEEPGYRAAESCSLSDLRLRGWAHEVPIILGHLRFPGLGLSPLCPPPQSIKDWPSFLCGFSREQVYFVPLAPPSGGWSQRAFPDRPIPMQA